MRKWLEREQKRVKLVGRITAGWTMTQRDPDRVESRSERVDDRSVAPQPQSIVRIVERPFVPSPVVDEGARQVCGYRPYCECYERKLKSAAIADRIGERKQGERHYRGDIRKQARAKRRAARCFVPFRGQHDAQNHAGSQVAEKHIAIPAPCQRQSGE